MSEQPEDPQPEEAAAQETVQPEEAAAEEVVEGGEG
jgi:hypothetical protein